MPGSTFVILNDAHIQAFLNHRPLCDDSRLLALTPGTRYLLAKQGFACEETSDLYGSMDQAETLRAIDAMERRCSDMDVTIALPPTARTTLVNILIPMEATAQRLERSLGDGPWMIAMGGGWRLVHDRAQAVTLLLEQLDWRGLFPPPRPMPFYSPAPLVARLAACLAARCGVLLFESTERGFAALIDKIRTHADAPMVAQIVPATGGLTDMLRALKALWIVLTRRKATLVLPVSAPRDSTVARDAARYLDGIAGRGLPPSLKAVVVDATAHSAGMVQPLRLLLAALRPACLLTFQMRFLTAAAIAEACGAQGIRRVLVSHGSHPVPADEVAAIVLRHIADGLLVSPLADEIWLQSPHAEAALAAIGAEIPSRRICPLVWGHQAVENGARHGRRCRILHAGTYKSLNAYRPWMYETSDEYVRTLVALAEVVAQRPQMELVIRPRLSDDCHMEALRALLPEAPNVVVKLKGSFLDDLAGSDLLVSDASTTIEEALGARIPVLLWTTRGHYHHLLPSFEPPQPGNRAAIYGARDKRSLGPMLDAICGAHAGYPLTAAELHGHVWQQDVPGMVEIANDLVGLASRTKHEK